MGVSIKIYKAKHESFVEHAQHQAQSACKFPSGHHDLCEQLRHIFKKVLFHLAPSAHLAQQVRYSFAKGEPFEPIHEQINRILSKYSMNLKTALLEGSNSTTTASFANVHG